MVARYAEPVHYQDESGIWIDIDNTVTEAEATANQAELFGTDNLYTTSNLAENVVFAEKSNSNTLVSYEAKDYPISLNYQSAKNSKIKIIEDKTEFTGNDAYLTLPNVSEEVIYEDIFKNVDLQYIVSPTELKENIILKNSKAQNAFTVNYNIGELTAEVIDTKTVNLMAGNEVVYTISAPYMYDANGEKSENITLTVDKNKNGKLRIDITADSAWLQAEDRAYPVVIDPSIVETESTSLTATYVSSATPTVNYSNSVEVLQATKNDSTYGTSYALLELVNRGSDIVADHIVSAKLNLPVNSTTSSSIYLNLYEITSAWDAATVTWNTKPSMSSLVSDYHNMATSSDTITFDITKLYYEWDNDVLNGNGVAVVLADDGAVSFKAAAETPVLILNYISTTGIDEKFSYSEFDMGSAGYVYVNNLSGNLVLTRDEIDTTGENNPYDFSNTYNSLGNLSEKEPVWFKSYDTTITYGYIYQDSDCSAELLDFTTSETEEKTLLYGENEYGWEKGYIVDSQKIFLFSLNVKSFYMPLPGTIDVWRNDETEHFRFGVDGLLEKGIIENGTEKLIFSREATYNEDETVNSNLYYLVDGDGDKIQISLTDSSETFTQIDYKADGTYLAGDVLVYTKDANGNTTQITLNGNIQAVFTYDDLNRMTSVTNDAGYKLAFGYEGESRKIASVAESKNGTAGQEVAYTRTYNTTTARTSGANGIFGDSDDLMTKYKFNEKAQLVATESATFGGDSLGALKYEHDDTAENTLYSPVSKISAVGKNANNLLKNHNIESATDWNSKAYADSAADYTVAVSDEKAYVGLKSFKITANDFTKGGSAGYYQTITPDMGVLEAGQKYVASAYINTTTGFTKDADTLSNTSYGAFVMIEITDSSGISRSYSNSIVKTDININEGWDRAFLSFTVPEDYTEISFALIVRNGTGTAYFDGAQLEKGNIPNQYNMLENNGFYYADSNNYATGWKRWNLTSSDVDENGEMKIIGAAGTNKCVYQEVKVTENDYDDKYIFSGWAHASPTAKKGSRYYRIHILIYYKETNSSGSQISRVASSSDFNYYSDELQYTSGSFELQHPSHPEYTPDKIRVVCCYYQQLNTAYYDSVSLVKSGDVYEAQADTEDTSEETTADPYTYDADGNILTYTDEDGVVYTYTYNSYGDIVSILSPNGAGDLFEYYEYDTDGDGTNDTTLIKKETYEDGTVCEYEYDADRNLTKETIVSDGVTTVYTYDADGKLLTESETLGSSYTYTYDEHGNMTSRLDSDGNGDRYTYQYFDLNNNGEYDKYEISYESLANGTENWYTYDAKGDLTRMVQKENGKTLAYNYDSEGKVTSVEHNGFSYNYTYDVFGNTTAVKVGSQSLVTYGYQTDKSKLSSVTYGNGSGAESYTYDAYGLVTKKAVSGRGTAEYRYDTIGRLVYQRDLSSDRRTYFTYDIDGKLTNQQTLDYGTSNTYQAFLFSSLNEHDDSDRLVRKVITGKQYELDNYYHYDDTSGLLSSVASTSGGSRRLDYTYDEEERPVTKTMTTNTNAVHSYVYDDDGLISTHTVAAKEGTNAYGYTYDDNGNITQITKNGTVQQSYVYDSENQLIRANDRDTNKSVVYTYDGYGNISQKTEYVFTTGTLGTATDTINYTYDTTWKDKLTSYDGQSITYDAIGNPTNYMGATLTWNGRQLMSYTTDADTISYKYDSNGMRTQKVVNGVTHDYYYEDGQLLYEIIDGVYEMYYKYDADGNLFTVTRYRYSDGRKDVFYADVNTRGDVVALRNYGGTIYCRYVYDSWGRCISVTNSSGEACSVNTVAVQNSIRYRGYVYDYETELYYLQSRYYDPEVGRFLNADMDYILEPSLLKAELLCAVADSGVYVDMSLNSTYSMRVNGNLSSGYMNDVLEAVIWLPIAFELYEKNGISTSYLTYGTIDIDVEIFYQVPDSEDAVIKVTITAKGDKQYDELTSGYYQTRYETVFYAGLWTAWSMYHMNSVSSREKNYNAFSKVIELLGTILSVASLFNPESFFLSLIGALDTAASVRNGVYGSLSWFEEAYISRFDKYIYNLLEESYGTSDVVMFLFSIIDRTIEYANQKSKVIYRVKL